MRFASLFAGLALFFTASTAQAGLEGFQRSFVFSGDGCTVDCQEGASAKLTVFDFGIGIEGAFGPGGTDLSNSFIDNFEFKSDSGVFDGFEFLGGSGTGVLFGTPDELADISISGSAFVDGLFAAPTAGESEPSIINFLFLTSVTGDWSMEIVGGDDDVGTIGTWNTASEPGALALLGIGLIGLAVMRRRRQLAA